MSGIPSGSIKMIPRVELQLWGKLSDGNPSVSRVPDYSDYGVVHPDLQDINPRVMRASAKIRYTLDDNWLILKGAGLQSHPRKYNQYHDLSSQLASDHRYLGANFSWGDSYIYDCASEAAGAHAYAVSRERRLLSQRPNFTEYPAGGMLRRKQ